LGETRGPKLFCNMHGWEPILMYYPNYWKLVLFLCEHRQVLCA
jgi:hypothetical protein